MPLLSIIVPIYNEERYLATVLKDLDNLDMGIPTEIVAVDDASTDSTPRILAEASLRTPLCVRSHEVNRGKGGAVRTGIEAASGDLCVVFDADPEYSSSDIPRLVDAFLTRQVDAVYGVRSFGGHSSYSFWYVMGNKAVTLFGNMLYNSYIQDLETCLKLIPTAVLRSMELESNTFTIEAEITAKLLRSKARIYEIPVSYTARTREEGKKLSARDGIFALLTLLRYRLSPPLSGVGRRPAA
jgi:cellulose synthase/poly-beta-1,6-N-acetylglucosamine synthase-like glycosyltransferase